MDLSLLKGHIPDSVLAELPFVTTKFNISTELRLAHFLSQCAHESGEFRAVRENLNYSAAGLKRVFGKYFKEPGLAEKYARKPEMIASRVYANRMGNGDEASREGWKFRGRGYIQLTGKNSYALFSTAMGLDFIADPDLVASEYPLSSAGWFFWKNKINSISDLGATDPVITRVTKAVNGGTNGLANRIKHFYEYYAILT